MTRAWCRLPVVRHGTKVRPSTMTSMSTCSGGAMSRVSNQNVRGDSSTSLTADSGSRRPSTPTFAHAARWWPRTSRGRPHRQVRKVEEEHPELLSVENRRMETCWTAHEGQTSHWVLLGTSTWPSPRLGDAATQMWPEEEILHLLGSFALPPLSWPSVFIVTSTGSLAFCQRCPTGRVETHINKSVFGLDQSRQVI